MTKPDWDEGYAAGYRQALWEIRMRAIDEEKVAHFLAERFTAITSRRDDDPVDVCRFHRELAEDLIDWWPSLSGNPQ